MKSKFQLLVLVLLLLLIPFSALALEAESFDTNRARLLGHILHQQLSSKHYSQFATDDTLSHKAFDLYLEQLDSQKRFLLQEDVDTLRKYRSEIDDAIRRGRLDLPLTGREILDRRIAEVQTLVDELLAEKIDPTLTETIETDPDKYTFVKNEQELRERWRKILKLQILSRYVSLREDEIGVDDNGELLPVDETGDGELFVQAVEKIGKSTRNMLSRMLEETEQDHYDRYLNAISRAYDPHTNYLPPMSKEDFDIQMSGTLEGIGATLREEDGYIKVVRIIPGSAASRQGQLEADDIILKVAEGEDEPVDITDTRIRDAVALIRGKKGTEVRLTVKKQDGRQLIIPIIRDVVVIEESFVKGTAVVDEKSGKTFGYIKIPSFYRDFTGKTGNNCTDDMRAELEKLKKEKIAGLIVDLRNNGGGALADAVSITGLFIKTGPVVQVRDTQGNIQVKRDTDSSVVYDGPLVVLVNRFSASASEIVAGALQDYGRALIVGDEHTHGKGTVQAMLDLDSYVKLKGMGKYLPLGASKITIQKFYRISGESTQEKGVTPDIILPSRLDGLESGEKYLDNALPWDHIAASDYKHSDKFDQRLDLLRQESHERVAASEDFQDIATAAASATERREQTLQSLKLEDILSERKSLRAEEDKLLAHGGMMGMDEDKGADAEKKDDADKDKKDEKKTLAEEIADDPYVEEGIYLLDDYLAR
ncbi:MAG: tail-specific protease [Desulfuromonas sp.]|nr:MAG: tail-specific protease [Desulfuromonas sp.]